MGNEPPETQHPEAYVRNGYEKTAPVTSRLSPHASLYVTKDTRDFCPREMVLGGTTLASMLRVQEGSPNRL